MIVNSKYFKTDVLAGLVVFLIALPLCLGIALASGAPLFAGIITGVIGGIVVGILSGSQLSVAGPAAGLTAIVLAAIATLGSYEAFLLAVLLAGIMQIGLGFAKAGTISNYLPTNVIEGMLTGIGIIIIIKQLPLAIGYDPAHKGSFFNFEQGTTFMPISETINAINYSHLGAIIVTLISIAILISFNQVPALKKIKVIPGALVAVIIGTLINEFFVATGSNFAISQAHLVNLPVPESMTQFLGQFATPDFGQISRADVWVVAATIAAVASIETLLCLEAADKMDPMKRITGTNRELKAQGIGNMLCGLIGGIPMTSVIVRTSANINSGGRTRVATIAHGIFLLLAVVAVPFILNKIPLATLAAVLIMIGYKLASPKVFRHMWHNGFSQFIPFAVTVIGVVFTDLLMGVGIGLAVSIFFILKGNLKLAYFFRKEDYHEGETIRIELAQEVSFLNKAAIKRTLAKLPEGSKVVIDASKTVYIDHDVVQLISDFREIGAAERNIDVTLTGFKSGYKIENSQMVTSGMEPAQKAMAPSPEYHSAN